MDETVLRQIVRRREITRQLAQEIPHMRLVAADELAESIGILSGYDPGDELAILTRGQGTTRLCLFAGKSIQKKVRHANCEGECRASQATTQSVARYVRYCETAEHEANRQ